MHTLAPKKHTKMPITEGGSHHFTVMVIFVCFFFGQATPIHNIQLKHILTHSCGKYTQTQQRSWWHATVGEKTAKGTAAQSGGGGRTWCSNRRKRRRWEGVVPLLEKGNSGPEFSVLPTSPTVTTSGLVFTDSRSIGGGSKVSSSN